MDFCVNKQQKETSSVGRENRGRNSQEEMLESQAGFGVLPGYWPGAAVSWWQLVRQCCVRLGGLGSALTGA